jgi:hypothetical protein
LSGHTDKDRMKVALQPRTPAPKGSQPAYLKE